MLTRMSDRGLNRQEQVFEMSVMYGMTVRQIARMLRASLTTIIADLKRETLIRVEAQKAREDHESQIAIEFYTDIARQAQNAARDPVFPGDVSQFGTAVKARERIDRIKGIDAPVRIDAGIDGLVAALSARNEPKEE